MKLFINYRREDTDDFAGRLHDYLLSEFGSENIFKDVDSIRPGQNWKVVLEESVAQCDVVLTLIGRNWASIADKNGQPRIKSEEDWVRFELEAAYRANRLVMPILVKGTTPLRQEDLPQSLHWLTDIHATEVRGGSQFKDDVSRLIDELRIRRERIKNQPKPAPHSGQPADVSPTVAEGAIYCPTCRKLCSRNDKFCEGCGLSLWTTCPKCASPVLAGQRFCKNCGADVIKFAQAAAQQDALYRRFTTIATLNDGIQILTETDQLLRDVDVAQAQFLFFTPLAELRSQIRATLTDKVKSLADAAYQARDLGRTLQLDERLNAILGNSPGRSARIAEIQNTRKSAEERATEFYQKGDIRKAHTTLSELAALFPQDSLLAEKIKHHAGILERVKQMSETGIRELLNQRRLVQLDREITWLQSTRMNIQKLPDIAANVRKKLAEANNAIARAHAEMNAGNVRAAQNIAREILESVSDHEEANAIVRQSSSLVDKVAQIQAYVEHDQWCAARILERQVLEDKINDPRLPKLSARIKAEISTLDNQLMLLAGVTILILIMALYGIPWLVSSYFKETALPTGYYLAAAAASLVLLFIMWSTFRSKAQTIQRLFMFFPGRQRRDSVLPTVASSSAETKLPDLTVPTVVVAKPVTAAGEGSNSSIPPVQPQPDPAGKTTVVLQPLYSQPEQPASKPDVLSATELDQRLETTCFSIEWLTAGFLASLVGLFLASKLTPLVKTEWLKMPINYFVSHLFILAAFLYLNRFNRWQGPTLFIAISSMALTLLCYLTSNEFVTMTCFYLLICGNIGLLSSILLRSHTLKAIAAAVVGPIVTALLASPFVVALLFLVSLVTPANPDAALGRSTLALMATSMIWCLFAVTLCSASGTIVRFIVVDQVVVRGTFAVALALITACLVYSLVAVLTLVLHEKIRWIASWFILFLLSQAVIPLLRFNRTTSRPLATAIMTACLFVLLALGDWLAPGLPLMVSVWCLSAACVVLLRTRSLDTFAYDQDFRARLRSHMRTPRMPFSIQIRRMN